MNKTNYSLIILFIFLVTIAKAEDNYSLGLKKYSNSDYQGAIVNFTKAIEMNPGDARAYCKRGNAKSILKDYTGAIKDCTKSIEINPVYAEAYNVKGTVYLKINDTINAINYFKIAVKIIPLTS